VPTIDLGDSLFVPYQFVAEVLPRYLGELYQSVGRTADAGAAFAEAAKAFGELGAERRAAQMRERLATL